MLNAGRRRGSLRPIRERSPRWKGRQARSRLTAPRRLGRRRPLALVCGYRRGIRDGTHKSSRSNLPLCEAMRTRSHERPLLAQPSLFNHCLLRFGLPTSSKSRQAEVSAQSRLRPNNITNASGVSPARSWRRATLQSLCLRIPRFRPERRFRQQTRRRHTSDS
jgi:hypothetical protein